MARFVHHIENRLGPLARREVVVKLQIKLAAILSVLWMTAGPVQAGPILNTPILGGNFLVAADGEVFAEYLGSSAGYFSVLYLGDTRIFDNRSSAPGLRKDLGGGFSKGDELVFRLFVDDIQKNFYSGDGSLNPDGLAHFEAISTAVGNGFLTAVGVEDQLGGGDRDFNDFMFSLSNVIDPPANEPSVAGPAAVSEPPVLFLLACGITGLLARRRQPV